MIYKEFQGKSLSALGMGCMRFPLTPENEIDEAAVARMFDYAIANGVNYFDTAWGYHSGKSELVVGKTLEKYPRESFYLASKFPGFHTDIFENKEATFERQLEKCRVDYFDFYLLHSVTEANVGMYIDEKYGLIPYLLEQKAKGRIRHLGFSAHGDMPVLRRLLEACGEHMEFCQLQINYIDWDYQNAKEKVALMTEYGIPVWVMEPLRGGSLCNLPIRYQEELAAVCPDETPTATAFRFIQSIPEVIMTLSGMSNEEQLKQNVETYRKDAPLTPEQFNCLRAIGQKVVANVPCTACRYCTDGCPANIDIPAVLRIYNQFVFDGDRAAAVAALAALSASPAACLSCHACEEVCPQKIKIADMMKKVAALAE